MLKRKPVQRQTNSPELLENVLEEFTSAESKPESSLIELPDDITKLSPSEMRRMHNRVVAWLGYRQGQWGKLSARQVILKKYLSDRAAHLSFQFPNMEKWRMEHLVKKDAMCREVLEEMMTVEASLAALEMELEKLERRSQLLSREQSWRESEMKCRM